VPQLQELAHGPDAKIAEWASEKLKQIFETFRVNDNDRF
jgi:hypothetical protein